MPLKSVTSHLPLAVQAQSDVFDSHDIIFWLARKHPRDYAADLAESSSKDPIKSFHSAIGIALKKHARPTGTKELSLNTRGEWTPCEIWSKKSASTKSAADLPDKDIIRLGRKALNRALGSAGAKRYHELQR